MSLEEEIAKANRQPLTRRTPSEHLAHFRGNLRKRERFGDEVQFSIQLPTVNDRTARKTSCVQDLDIWLPSQGLGSQLLAVDIRHDDIREKHRGFGMRVELFQGAFGAVRMDDRISQLTH